MVGNFVTKTPFLSFGDKMWALATLKPQGYKAKFT
jgi:hypothetical protein